MTQTEELLRELIAIPSVNPAFLPATDLRAGEKQVAEFVAALARRAGLEVSFQPVLPGRSNLFAYLKPLRKPRRRLVLAPHFDTVGGEDPSNTLFQPRRSRGRLYGRGACDTKGSVAAMLAAVLDLAKSVNRPRETEIIFAGLVDEESGQAGSRALAASGFKADLAIVGEPTRSQVVTAHKGALWLQLETKGKAAHGARPELGRNAIYLMARIVECLETNYAAALRRRKHLLTGRATINVGSIRGGLQPNIVPAECVISIDRRTLPGERPASVIREIRTFLRKRGLTALIRPAQDAPCPPLETKATLPLVQEFLRAAGQKTPCGVDYFSDAAVLAAAGIPSVVFGPGDIAQAHTPDEWIDLKQLEQSRRLLVRFLQSLP